MVARLRLGDLSVEVVRKDIENVHLTVHPPTGRVRVSAPAQMSVDTIRVFVISKLGWIRRQQQALRAQARETRREYLDGESHYVWGKRYLLRVIETDAAPTVTVSRSRLQLRVRPGADADRRRGVLDGWYRSQLKQAVPPLVARWEPVLGVRVRRFFVQRMKTKWGSCATGSGSIRLNAELAKKPPECLEYLVVHEMVHLLEPTHNARFVALMDRVMPDWEFYRRLLNALPVRHEEWEH